MHRFDLDIAVAAWRNSLAQDSALLDDDLDELESHIRDHVTRLAGEGISEKDAFDRALRRLGPRHDVEAEYRKVRLTRQKRRRSMLRSAVRSRIMLRSYVTVALRRMLRYPGYSAINVVGLAIGIACCLLIFLFVRNELAVNDVFADTDRIYRVGSNWARSEMGLDITTLAPIGATLTREYPEVVDFVRMYLMSGDLRVDDRGYRREIMMADSSLLVMFDIPLVRGDPRSALTGPRSAVITEELARDLFGTADALGRTLHLRTWQRGEQPYTVTGIRETLPYNSITYFGAEKDRHDLIISAYPFGDFFQEAGWTAWGSRYILQFVKLSADVSVDDLRKKLTDFIETYAPSEFHGALKLHLDPLRTLYLDEDDGKGWQTIRLLQVAALMILLLATINFTNLATARSLTRAREVGVRKAVGANRSHLTLQFLFESVLTCAVSTAIGVGLAAAFLHPMFLFTGRDRVIEHIGDPITVIVVVGIALMTGVVAGLYPAVVLSSFRPIKAIKGYPDHELSGRRIRQSLVVVQFTAAVVLLVAVGVVSRQLAYVAEKDLGFESENILVIDSVPRDFTAAGVARMQTVRSRLADIPGVISVSLSWRTAAEGGDSRAVHPPELPAAEAISVPTAIVDEHFDRVFGLRIEQGRFFNGNSTVDDNGIVLNEAAAQLMGWDDGIEGKSLVAWPGARASESADPPLPVPVIGVVADYHFESLHNPIGPLAFISVNANPMYRVLSARLASGDVRATLERIQLAWEDVLPGAPSEFTFVDDQVARAYRSETQIRDLASVSAGLAVLLACFGMLGLVSISSIQRTKETGIRKAMGATVTQIVVLLSADFLKPVAVAILVSCPLGYLLMRSWLQDYAYRIDLGPFFFLSAAGAGVAVATLALGYHVTKTALANPVESLRHE